MLTTTKYTGHLGQIHPIALTELHTNCTTRIENCIDEIRSWMNTNMLKLNDDKTVIHYFWHEAGTKSRSVTSKLELAMKVLHQWSTLETWALYHGSNSHQEQSSYQHNSHQPVSWKLMKCARPWNSKNSSPGLSYVHSWIIVAHYQLGPQSATLTKLQCIQNMAYWVIFNLHRFSHISHWMIRLHWLKIWERITYKTATLVHWCKTRSTPQSLIDLLSKQVPSAYTKVIHIRQYATHLLQN